MPTLRRLSVVAVCLLIAGAVWDPFIRAQQAATEAPTNAKTWLEKRQAIEDYLKVADVTKMEEIGVGVAKPRRAYLAPGGLVDEPLLAKVAQLSGARVSRSIIVVSEVTTRDDSERTHCRERPRF